MVLTVTLSPKAEENLRELARAAGTTVEEVARAKLEGLDVTQGSVAAATLTPQERAKKWAEWTASFPRREGVHLDDSRESIYAGRGE